MNDKKVIESYKTVRAVEQAQPQSLKPEDVVYIQNMIDDAWVEVKANPRDAAEGLKQLRTIIDNETNLVKREFHERIYGIADRMSHRSKQLPVSNDASETKGVSDSDMLPLPERIRFLRRVRS
jgi:hypothetical protein